MIDYIKAACERLDECIWASGYLALTHTLLNPTSLLCYVPISRPLS